MAIARLQLSVFPKAAPNRDRGPGRDKILEQTLPENQKPCYGQLSCETVGPAQGGGGGAERGRGGFLAGSGVTH